MESYRYLCTGLTLDLPAENPTRDTTAAENFRLKCRTGGHTGQTSGVEGIEKHVQANLVILPKQYAFDFLLFCLRNPKACPLLDVTDPGSAIPKTVAPGADLRTDLPKYRVWRHGKLVEEVTDISHIWRDDLVCFLLGCSFSWEDLLTQNGLPPRHIEMETQNRARAQAEGKGTHVARTVPMYETNVPNVPSGPFAGNLVVSMRPYLPEDIPRVSEITSRFPSSHGAPIAPKTHTHTHSHE
eukprot:GDKI01035478.1.p1 GENE.GDKI01035478.1~~GDKI01035478.1.p1  ORF type:complete len:250 (-),score=58.61 GDKI01035478.1:416-1138(-)